MEAEEIMIAVNKKEQAFLELKLEGITHEIEKAALTGALCPHYLGSKVEDLQSWLNEREKNG